VKFVLVGAGGHSKVLVEMIYASGGSVAAYIDREPADWLDAPQFKDDNPKTAPVGPIVIGIGAVNPESLQRRLVLLDSYLAAGRDLPPIIHPAATVSASAAVDAGAMVLAGAIMQPAAHIARGVIANTGSIIEHDSSVGAGSHVGPGAVVLGNCNIGERVMVGAGAVVLNGVTVPSDTLVRAGERYPQ
jgi:UDP-perosamine 4-acetyltransferase